MNTNRWIEILCKRVQTNDIKLLFTTLASHGVARLSLLVLGCPNLHDLDGTGIVPASMAPESDFRYDDVSRSDTCFVPTFDVIHCHIMSLKGAASIVSIRFRIGNVFKTQLKLTLSVLLWFVFHVLCILFET